MPIILKVKADEELFERWQDLPNIFEHEEFGAIVQNDLEITNDQLIEWMNQVRAAEKSFLDELHQLYMDTIKHVRGKGPTYGRAIVEKPKKPTGRFIKEKDMKKGRNATPEISDEE